MRFTKFQMMLMVLVRGLHVENHCCSPFSAIAQGNILSTCPYSSFLCYWLLFLASHLSSVHIPGLVLPVVPYSKPFDRSSWLFLLQEVPSLAPVSRGSYFSIKTLSHFEEGVQTYFDQVLTPKSPGHGCPIHFPSIIALP